jgi:choline dehydrogenase-like flavoprotein
MSIADARALAPGTEIRAEICIVGAGAAGITLATELARGGHDVCLIESGGFGPDEQTQQLYDLENVGYPIREQFMSRARYYGGSCNLWAGRSMRLEAADLARRAWVPEAEWPIPYAELAVHYPRAATILRLPPLEWFDRARDPAEMSDWERGLFSHRMLRPTVSLWAKRPMRFGAAYRSELRRSARVRVVLYTNVTGIALTPEGTAVAALQAATLGGTRLVFRARDYVLASGALETARLMLVSRDVHAAGVGNAHDLVGRYFMDHPRAVFGRVRLYPGARLPLLRGRLLPSGLVQVGIGLTPMIQRDEGLLNHYATLETEASEYTQAAYQSFIRTMKVLLRRGYAGNRARFASHRLGDIRGLIYLLTPKEIVPHAAYRWYRAVRDAGGHSAGGTRVVVYFCEQPPAADSRITLSIERDRLDMNKLVLDWRISPEVIRGVLRLQAILRQALKAAEVGELEPGDGEPAFTDASHHMGTTRMNVHARHGVVDVDGRVHGVGNLFVAGSAVFPSAGHANPTFTIVALALRLADRLRRR